jgi:probable HAF family extracellular repeat protein
VPSSITSTGQIARDTPSAGSYQVYAFVGWAEAIEATFYIGGTPRSLPAVEDINSNGQVVGSMDGEPLRAFVLERGELRPLGIPFDDSRYDWSVAEAINDHGSVAGTAGGGAVPQRAFLWEGGRFVDLGGLGGSWSAASDVNGSGDIVGATSSERARPPLASGMPSCGRTGP